MGEVPRAADLPGASPDEDQGGHSRGRDHEHRDLAECVPRSHVDQGDVDHVPAPAEFQGQLGQVDRYRDVDPRLRDDEGEAGDGETNQDSEPEADPAPTVQGTVGEVGRETTEDEYVDEQCDRLHQNLVQRQVGAAVEEEEQGGPIPGDAGEHDRLQPAS